MWLSVARKLTHVVPDGVKARQKDTGLATVRPLFVHHILTPRHVPLANLTSASGIALHACKLAMNGMEKTEEATARTGRACLFSTSVVFWKPAGDLLARLRTLGRELF